MDELVIACQKIKDAGIVKYPLVMPLAAQAGTAARWELLSLAYGEPLFDDNFQPLFAKEGSSGYKAMELMTKYIGELVDPASVDLDVVNIHDTFLAGNGTFTFSGAGLLSTADDPTLSKIVGKAAIALIPGTTTQRSALISFLDGLAVSKLSEHPDAAWKFIEWFISPEAAEMEYKELAIFPTSASILRKFVDEGLIAGGDFIFEQSKYEKPVFPAGLPTWYNEWETDVAVQVNQVARGNITIMEGLNNIANKALELQK